jgi:succinate-semialdehyde dehydrogenase / glutarate-semialdehyde dehydrogenase
MATNGNTNGTHSLPFKLNDPDLLHQQSYINGKWVDAKSGKRFDIVDPGSDKAWASCPDNDVDDVDNAIQTSHKAFKEYSVLNPRKRAEMLLKWHELITANKDDIAKILTYETGKPLAESYGELTYSLGFTWWFAGEAERIQGSISVPSAPNRRTFVIKQPIGVAVALVPWNFPIAMILRKAGAAFAAGCTMVVKPSPETPLTCLTLAHLATKAGFAPGVFNVLTTSLGNTPALSQALIEHPLTKKVTFTGSTRVGKLVAGLCAKGLKKCTLELGGNCPFIIFDDADLEEAAGQYMALKWRHAGQACITANRLYVQSGVYDKFTQILVEKTKALKVGHGATEGTTMGPVTTPRGLAKAEEQAADAVKHGAKLVLGTGKAHKGATEGEGSGNGKGVGGYFMDPTILTGMTPDMLMSKEETFAPVAGIYKFEKEEEVVKWANETSMGLASYAFTKNVDRLWRMLENLEAGMIGLVSLSPMDSEGRNIANLNITEHWQLVRCRVSIWWHQGEWLRQRVWQGCRSQRVSHLEDRNIHYFWSILMARSNAKRRSEVVGMQGHVNCFILYDTWLSTRVAFPSILDLCTSQPVLRLCS